MRGGLFLFLQVLMKTTLNAVSKVNLFLKVTGSLPGGFHSIETLFVPVKEIFDTLEFETDCDQETQIEVLSGKAGVPSGEKNLCYKAASLYFRAAGLSVKLRIRLQKRIPVAAGMGGGSSDAASVLRFLQDTFGALPDGGKAIALECGSDVPYFLNPVPAIGRGRGEILEPCEGLPLPDIRIAAPHFPVSAKWAYQHFREDPAEKRTLPELLSALENRDFEKAGNFLRNDLAPAVAHKFPVESLLMEKFLREGALGSQITGSGPTVYCIGQRPSAGS